MYKTLIAICVIVSGTTIFYACSDSPAGNDSDNDNGSNEPTEFSAGITSPANGDILEGVVTITAEAEASGGIEEVRFFLGDTLLFSADSSPFEYEIDTREYPNGTHEIRIEAALAEGDSVITKTVSVELENYMVEFETEGFVTNFNNQNSNNEWLTDYGLYIFISAPGGDVLAEKELTRDGILQLLPPEALPDDAPAYYQLTIAQYQVDINGRENLNLTTETGLESWTSFRITETTADSEPNLSPQEVSIDLHNIQNDPFAFYFLSPTASHLLDRNRGGWSTTGAFQYILRAREDTDHLIIASLPSPPPYAEGVVPRYYWGKNLLNADVLLSHDVVEQFKDMNVHSVSFPSNIQHTNIDFAMSVEQDSWESGAIFFPIFPMPFFSQETSSGHEMYVPNTNHQYRTTMSGTDVSAGYISYRQVVRGALPSSFEALDAEVTLTNVSLDDMQMQASGTMDFITLQANAAAQTYRNNWRVFLPDTATAFVFPRIADSLDQKITTYNRSNLQLVGLSMEDYAAVDGYVEYREHRYAGEGDPLYEYKVKNIPLNTGPPKRKPRMTDDDIKSFMSREGDMPANRQDLLFSPSYRLIGN